MSNKEFFGSTYESEARLKMKQLKIDKLQTKLEEVTAERDNFKEAYGNLGGIHFQLKRTFKDLLAKLEAVTTENESNVRRMGRENQDLQAKLEASEKDSRFWKSAAGNSEGAFMRANRKLQTAVEELNWIDERCCEPCCLHAREALEKIKGME